MNGERDRSLSGEEFLLAAGHAMGYASTRLWIPISEHLAVFASLAVGGFARGASTLPTLIESTGSAMGRQVTRSLLFQYRRQLYKKIFRLIGSRWVAGLTSRVVPRIPAFLGRIATATARGVGERYHTRLRDDRVHGRTSNIDVRAILVSAFTDAVGSVLTGDMLGSITSAMPGDS